MPSASEKAMSPSTAARCNEKRRRNWRPGRSLSLRCSYTAEAAFLVVVDDADRLHEGVADGRSDEAEAALEQILAHRLCVLEAPDVGVEAAEFLLYREEGLRIAHRALDLQPVPYDARVTHQ